MTNREYLAQMSDEDLADWLCRQMWSDYDEPKSILAINVMRFHTVRNFLMMEYREENEDD